MIDISAYAALVPAADDIGLSRSELQAMWNLGDSQARAKIRELVAKGKLLVGRKSTAGSDGRRYIVPVYRLPEKEKKR